MHISEIFGNAVSYIPVIRAVVSIFTGIISISAGAVRQVENEIKQIESIHRWLKDNDVNTFTEYYEKEFMTEEEEK